MQQLTIDDVSAAIDPLREGFQSDGATLVVEAVSDRSAVVRLVITDETCRDCIVHHDILQMILAGAISDVFPEITRIEVIDPRLEAEA